MNDPYGPPFSPGRRYTPRPDSPSSGTRSPVAWCGWSLGVRAAKDWQNPPATVSARCLSNDLPEQSHFKVGQHAPNWTPVRSRLHRQVASKGAEDTGTLDRIVHRHPDGEFDTDTHDKTTIPVLSRWEFLGTGYSPGESLLLAETVRHQHTLTLQFKHEGSEHG